MVIGMQNEIFYLCHPIPMAHSCKDCCAYLSILARSHTSGISIHDPKVSTDSLCQVDLVDDKQITLRDTRASFSWNLGVSFEYESLEKNNCIHKVANDPRNTYDIL